MEELKQFFEDINEIKHSEREGWKERDLERPIDTIASHSLGAALIAWVRAERTGRDSGKAVKTLLIHDLIMSYVEDYTPEDEEYSSKREFENKRAEKLIEDVPESISDEFQELFEEFQKEETEFSKFCRECDKLDTLFQALSYSEKLEEDHLTEFLDYYSKEFKTDEGERIFSKLREKSRNLE